MLNLRLQTFWIILLVLSALWVAATFGPLLYSDVSPTVDISAIVLALQGRGSPPQNAGSLVQKIGEQGGLLGRAIHIGHYAGTSVTFQHGASHTAARVSDTYIAWFQKLPKPILLVVSRSSQDGTFQEYEIGSSDSVTPIARAYLLPVAALAVSIFLVRRRKSPLLSDPSP